MRTTSKPTLLDVRTPQEFAEQHVAGAINIPLDQLSARMQELIDLPRPIIAYCRSGNRSGMAVSMMNQNGISDAMNGGGIADMLQAMND
ncbi:MAG: rhodanese-like domain-containing protein [Chitinophagaceae bacterium]|nr:MAG: rhodanese-like domain-containing protein [Chitinophagaceae bacterium]